MMRQLILTSMILIVLQSSATAQNYDEAKVGVYTLPPLLVDSNGKTVNNKSQWEKSRRAEVLQLFEDNVYGTMPKAFDSMSFKVVNDQPGVMQGAAHLKETNVTIYNNGQHATIHVVLFTPQRTKKAVATFLLINNRSPKNTLASRDTIMGFWPAEQVIAAGYGIAAFHVSGAAPDDKVTYQNGLLRLFPDELARDNGMKAIGAWAFAASRVLDYFEKEALVDHKNVIVVGHSRGGKASLWAAAQDQRFAMCVTNCSGNTGAALSKRNFGETVEVINTAFPHWFNNNYKKYNDNEAELPVDQHMLIALVAPRPVYATNATEDLWADPTGTYLAMRNAEPVFNLYSRKSNLPATPPKPDSPIIAWPLSYHNRTGIHDLTFYDWAQFVLFADRYLK
jgi:pimeloyl-ACP methyl ester carboxylesterase